MATLTEHFYSLVAPDIPNEWDVEELLEPYLNRNDAFCSDVFSHIPSIWPISNSLCYDFLRIAPETLKTLKISKLPQWVCEILDCYEKDGLRAAQRFMTDIEKSIPGYHCKTGLISLPPVAGRLLPFIRGVAGKDLLIASSNRTYTDTETIFLPPELCNFSDAGENLLLYKLILVYQWGYIRCGTFTIGPNDLTGRHDEPSPTLWLTEFFDTFDQPLLAQDIYFFLETIRVTQFLTQELPGLMRASRKLSWPSIIANKNNSRGARALINLQNSFLHGFSNTNSVPSQLKVYTDKLQNSGVSARDSIHATKEVYPFLNTPAEEYEGVNPLIFQGELRIHAIETVRKSQLNTMSEEFIDSLAVHLASLPKEKRDRLFESEQDKQNNTSGVESDITMIMDSEFAGATDEHQAPLLLTINNEDIDLPEDLTLQAESFFDEFGHIPGRFISSAIGKAGSGMASDTQESSDYIEDDTSNEPLCYDEWDYRRQGFRKNWCITNIKELPELRSGFINKTLNKYHGLMIRLRNQFEMIRTTDRFARRQRDGDDIDLDALIESLADTKAGLPPSDRLFVKLLRDQRDISVIFLVDMSNSTVGWVGTTIKESLVLMTEALDVLGDRYGIYGFSGMKRTRCELFHIKHLHEPYGDKVRERIGAISPKEYTRMGPAIRHGTELLIKSDSRVRLLITLTDGKPEDYDDYKGEYAIEDTRHALLEAKMAGIHPFCITIDHHAHDYMDHMYGPVNYIFVNDVKKLPMRMPEIYRALTT